MKNRNYIVTCPLGGIGGSPLMIFLVILVLLLPGGRLAAERIAVPGTIAVFPIRDSGIQLNALSDKSAQAVMDTCDRLGRFLPLESDRIDKEMDAIPEGSGEAALIRAAQQLSADLMAVITVATDGSTFTGTLALRSVSGQYRNMEQNIIVRSKVMMNIPLKLAREMALLHRDRPMEARLLEKRNGLCLLDAGQWQGLAPGRYRTAEGESITIRHTGRFQSLAVLPEPLQKLPRITIRRYPSYRAIARDLSGQIEYNTNKRYSLVSTGVKGQDPEKQFTLGMCIVNPGANACLPGYGSYLTTSYMGFKNTKPSVGGIVFSSLLIVTHFILPEAMTKFKINFVPGIMDKDKTRDMNNLQIFCWSTVPLTASVAFLDQLAYQFAVNSALPPFFMKRNESALVLSLFIPGGGLFYKGYRLPGWSFYLSEMFLAGFCVYTKDDKKKVLYGGIALGGVKLIELITAYFCPPAFNFFKYEQEGRISQTSFSMGIEPSENDDMIFKVGLSKNF